MKTDQELPFALDFAFEVPKGMEIEDTRQANDCISGDNSPSDDD
jgi:hypothetical protein